MRNLLVLTKLSQNCEIIEDWTIQARKDVVQLIVEYQNPNQLVQDEIKRY